MKVTILQWNVWFREDPLRLADFLASVDADILCLQELTTTSSDYPDFDIPAYLAERLDYYKTYVEAQRWETDGQLMRTQGNAVLSRYPLLAAHHVFVQESAGHQPPYDGEGRVYVEATADLGSAQLTAGTVHLSYVRNFGTSQRRNAEDAKLLEAIGTGRSNYIVTGDLNSLPNHPLLETISPQTGMVPAGPAYDVNTWSTKPDTFGGSTDNELKWRLDYVFTSPDLRVIEAKVLETDLSDHLPILVTVELKEAGV